METAAKVRENRLRRMAARQGYVLVKSRRRDPLALDYGLYVLVDDAEGGGAAQPGGLAADSRFADGAGLPLDEIERTLLEGRRPVTVTSR